MVMIVLPEITIDSAFTVAMMVNFLAATDLGAAIAGDVPRISRARKREIRFIIERVLQRDAQKLPLHRQLF